MKTATTTFAATGRRRDDVARLLAWYDRHRRDLPWRAAPGKRADPYRVWLSEVMLQQTTVATVVPYFEAFLKRWPDLETLAAAELDEVLHAWQGLGYYARARNLHRCARELVAFHGGRFPETEAELRRLPGIGSYTAAAIVAIAFDRRAVVVDGNVERVMARLFRVEEPLPGARARFRRLAAALTPAERPGDYAQAVMELGATVCVPRTPRCDRCPWATSCAGREIAERLPLRAPRRTRPTRRGMAFWLVRPDGAVLLRRRPQRGLLGGMTEFPSTEWRDGPLPDPASAQRGSPLAARRWRALPGVVHHTFTHFHLELAVLAGKVAKDVAAPEGCFWCPVGRLSEHALPTVMKKVAIHATRHL